MRENWIIPQPRQEKRRVAEPGKQDKDLHVETPEELPGTITSTAVCSDGQTNVSAPRT